MSAAMRVGIVGHGCWVQQHVFPGLIAAGAEVVAIVGRDAGRSAVVARTLGVGLSFASTRDMIDKAHLDAIVIAGPPQTHAEHLLVAFQAGLPALCEKPVGLNSNETAALLLAQGENPVLVGLTLRWHPAITRARHLILHGAIGEVRHVDVLYASPAGAAPDAEWDWHYDRDGEPGGVLSDLGPHAIDLVRWLASDIDAVHATSKTTIANRPLAGGGMRTVDNADVFDLQLTLRSGASAHILCSRVHPPAGAGVRVTLLGEHGSLHLDLNAPAQLVVARTGDMSGPETINADWNDIARAEMKDFLSLASGNQTATDLPTLADGHALQRVIDGALLGDKRRALVPIS